MPIESIVEKDRILLKDRGETVLTLVETVKGNAVEIRIEGNMRSDAKHFLGDELTLLVLLRRDIVIDMKKVTYLSAACSEVLLNTQRTVDETESGSMCLRNVPDRIYKEMQATGLSELLMIERTEG